MFPANKLVQIIINRHPMCCVVDCKPDIKPSDWTPCIECMDVKELAEYGKVTGDLRKWGGVPDDYNKLRCEPN